VNNSHADANAKSIEFTISPDGSVNTAKGLDSLLPGQQQAWQQWVARFALAWTLPVDGMKSGEKSQSEQAEQTGAPIAGLHWARKSLYVRDEAMPVKSALSLGRCISLQWPTRYLRCAAHHRDA